MATDKVIVAKLPPVVGLDLVEAVHVELADVRGEPRVLKVLAEVDLELFRRLDNKRRSSGGPRDSIVHRCIRHHIVGSNQKRRQILGVHAS